MELGLEKMMGLGAAGLLCGLIVGAVAFHGTEPPRQSTQSPAAERVARVATPASPSNGVPANAASQARRTTADPLDMPGELPPGVVDPHLPTDEDDTPNGEDGNPGDAEQDDDAAKAPTDGTELAEPDEEDGPSDVTLGSATPGLTDALRRAVEADRWFRKTRLAVHERLGTGALAQKAGLTPAGQHIVERVRNLEAHGLATLGYNVNALEQRIDGLSSADEAGVAELEAHLGKALIRLVMDFRILKVAGPFKLVSEAKLGKDDKLLRKLRRLAEKVAAAETNEAVSQLLDPPHYAYKPLLEAYARYQKVVAAGGCDKMPMKRVKEGDKGKAVEALQKRLSCEGLYDGPVDGQHNEQLLAAVKRYQGTHEMDPDGIVARETVKSLNVPMERRLEQLKLGLQRLRETRVREMNDYYLAVNIPSFELKAIENQKVIRRQRVIVGTNRLDDDKHALIQGHLNRTKLLTSKLYSVIVNPTWILPSRIAKGELKGKVAEDPEYLDKMNIRKKTLPNGDEVLVQGRGDGNVLGKVKFLLEKTNAIYLHDTDKPWLFKHSIRAFSHGCMRVHNATDFAKWLMLKDGWEESEIDRRLRLEKTEAGMRLKNPVTFMTEYVTVDVDDDGWPMFLTDVYGYDRAYAKGNLPPKVKTYWGAVRLRPRWVPRVPYSLIKEWRAAGKSAPRDPNWRPPKS